MYQKEESKIDRQQELSQDYLELVGLIHKDLQCLICHDTVKSPVISCKYCSNMFCEECIDAWKKQKLRSNPQLAYWRPFENNVPCPVCKQAFYSVQSKAINNILQYLPYHCSVCEEYIKREEKAQHNKICPHRDLKCQFSNCQYEGPLKKLMKHVITSHYEAIKERLPNEIQFEKCIEELDNLEKRRIVHEMKINDQTTYSGQVVNGVPDGAGLMSSNERKQFAFFKNDKPIVFQSITEMEASKDQNVNDMKITEEYFGFINAEGLKHGIGVLISTSGLIKRYEGMFNNGQFDGFGKIEYHNQNSYEGQLKDGKKEGFGKLILKYRWTYIGNFKDDLYDGEGKLVNHEKSTFYSGNWKQGKKHGSGLALYSDGVQDSGEFRDGKIIGVRVVTIPLSWRKIIGVFNSLRQGNDVQVSNFNYLHPFSGSLVDTYRGQVKDFYVPHGKGEILLHLLGLQFTGMFKNGIISGQGTIIDKKGQIEIKGLFDNLTLKQGSIKRFIFRNKNQSIEGTVKGLNIKKRGQMKKDLLEFLTHVKYFKGTYINRSRGVLYQIEIDYEAKYPNEIFHVRKNLVRSYFVAINFRDREDSIWAKDDFLTFEKQKSQNEESKESDKQPQKPIETIDLQENMKFEDGKDDDEKSALQADDEENSNKSEKNNDSNQQ